MNAPLNGGEASEAAASCDNQDISLQGVGVAVAAVVLDDDIFAGEAAWDRGSSRGASHYSSRHLHFDQ